MDYCFARYRSYISIPMRTEQIVRLGAHLGDRILQGVCDCKRSTDICVRAANLMQFSLGGGTTDIFGMTSQRFAVVLKYYMFAAVLRKGNMVIESSAMTTSVERSTAERNIVIKGAN